ncbi:hypothetical protein K1W54_17940, partial [Micromonospora sp. CPCC 205371]|nr:hypothetical protein [Micromonospora sp. CPCC 205371]
QGRMHVVGSPFCVHSPLIDAIALDRRSSCAPVRASAGPFAPAGTAQAGGSRGSPHAPPCAPGTAGPTPDPMARRVVVDHIRAAGARPRIAATDDWKSAADAAQAGGGPRFEDGVVLRRLLDDLAPDRREAFVATQVLGLSYEEAAEVCDCPVGTIRSRVARARQDLVAAMAETRSRRTG